MLIATALLVLQASVVLSAIVPDRRNVGVLFNWEKYKDFHGECLLRWIGLLDWVGLPCIVHFIVDLSDWLLDWLPCFILGKEYGGADDLVRKKIYLTNSQKIVTHNRKFAEGKADYSFTAANFALPWPFLTGFVFLIF